MKVQLVNKERGAINYKKLADLKGTLPEEMKHQLGDTSKPGAPSGVAKLVLDWAELHQAELLEDWNLCEAKQQPHPIAPLE